MKRILLLASFSFMIFSAKAQYQLSQAKNAPVAGVTDYQVNDTAAVVKPGGTGYQTWDLTSLQNHSEGTTDYVDPKTTPYSNKFPTANVAGVTSTGTIYYESSNSQVLMLGTVFQIPGDTNVIVAKSNPPQIMLKFPSTLGTTYSDSSKAVGTSYFGQSFGGQKIDSIRITNTTKSTVLYDAFGIVHTPHRTHLNALREKRDAVNQTKIEFFIPIFAGFGIWQEFVNDSTKSTTYSWYSEKTIFPVATITETYDSTGTTIASTSGTYSNDPSTGIFNSLKNQIDFNLYPNPAINEINIDFGGADVSTIKLQNVLGATLIETKINKGSSKAKIDLGSVSQGIYIVSLYNSRNEQIGNKKLVVGN